MKTLKFTQRAIATLLIVLSLFAAQASFSPAQASQQLFCTGRMSNGWDYNAEFLDGRFTQIRWNRSGQPPQVSSLSFDTTNDQGQPIYRGSLLAAVAVTLIDLGKGNVQPGSQISVGVDEWGWSRGNCGVSSSNRRAGSATPVAMMQQDLLDEKMLHRHNSFAQ